MPDDGDSFHKNGNNSALQDIPPKATQLMNRPSSGRVSDHTQHNFKATEDGGLGAWGNKAINVAQVSRSQPSNTPEGHHLRVSEVC
jgi:hypothetical protein